MARTTRNNIVLVKRATPKHIQLPESRTFYAKYKRVDRNALPHNVTLNRTHKKGRPVRGRQARVRRRAKLAHQVRGCGFKKFAKKAFNFGKK